MKNLWFIIILICTSVFWGCKTEEATTTSICLLLDVSDERFNNEKFLPDNINSILHLMKLDREKGGFSGGEVKISLINDISDSKSEKASIPAAKPGLLGQNPLIRRDEVVKFCTDLETIFTKTINKSAWGTKESKIYQKVARELSKLNKTQSSRKIMVIYSDMLENSNLFSFYKTGWQKEIEKMANDPEGTIKKLSEKGPSMPSLDGIEIIVITNRTVTNDEKINLSEQFWRIIFEEKGAQIRFDSVLEV